MKHYSEEHQWVQVDGDTVTVGISAFAAEGSARSLVNCLNQRRDHCWRQYLRGGIRRAASDVIAPVSGRVVEINASLTENPVS